MIGRGQYRHTNKVMDTHKKVLVCSYSVQTMIDTTRLSLSLSLSLSPLSSLIHNTALIYKHPYSCIKITYSNSLDQYTCTKDADHIFQSKRAEYTNLVYHLLQTQPSWNANNGLRTDFVSLFRVGRGRRVEKERRGRGKKREKKRGGGTRDGYF